MSEMRRKLELSMWLLFFGLMVFLCFNLNSKNTFDNYHDPIWSDAGGYYIYLPTTFIYGWEGYGVPETWPDKLGNGFELTDKGTVKTKYSVGVAIMEAPFFLIAHLFAIINDHGDGYSFEYHIGLWFAGVFYLVLGLFFLKEYLIKRYDLKSVLTTLVLILVGTNLYYYGLNSVGMSHIYSFFLFATTLWLSDVIIEKKRTRHLVLFSFLAGLIVIVRPTGCLYLIFLMVLSPQLFSTLFLDLFKRPFIALILLIAFLVPLLPQFIYWKFLTGNFFHYAYTGETFDWLKPELLKFWFSTNNGLFVYAPILLFSILGVVVLFKENRKQAIQYILFFLLISYVFSSWWCWWYGCSYGSRNFVEYLVPASIPFCLFVQRTFTSRFTSVKYFLFGAAVFFIFINLKIIYKYDDCFYGANNELWDWSTYYKLIF